jgi:hypothetical protein
VTALLVTTWWVEGMRVTIVAGCFWLAFISVAYIIWAKQHRNLDDQVPAGTLADAGADSPS